MFDDNRKWYVRMFDFNMAHAITLATYVVLILCLAGCATGGTQVSRAQAQQFQVGVTTQVEVEAALGAPQVVQDMPDGTLVIYSGMQARVKAATFIPIVGLFAGGSHVQTSHVSFTFDKAGKLQHISTGQYSADAHVGM